MAGDAEGRLKRAMDLLFSSPPSTSSPSSIATELNGKAGRMVVSDQIGAPRSLDSLSDDTSSTLSLHRVCRPWDKGDFFRRLATFKSMTWFGKPELADPVNCARKGWVNVDVDLIACEGCNTMLSFPTSSIWTQHEAENAAAIFSQKLDSGHKPLCPWKDNACSETLAQFPPTSAETLAKGFKDRCKALSQLIALPVIAHSAIQFLKTSRGPQIEHLLCMSPMDSVTMNGMHDGIAADSRPISSSNYFDAQKIISLCGWQLQLLPYSVECIGENKGLNASESETISHKSSVLGHHIMITSLQKEKIVETGEISNSMLYQEPKFDVGSAVLGCSLCGASVGLWLFTLVACPSGAAQYETETVPEINRANRIVQGSTAGHEGKQEIEKSEKVGDIVTNGPFMPVKKPAHFLNLRLTIAGGLPPTRLLHASEPSLSSTIECQSSKFPFTSGFTQKSLLTSAENDYISLKRKREEIDLESAKSDVSNVSDVDIQCVHRNIMSTGVNIDRIGQRSGDDGIKKGAAQAPTNTNEIFGDGRMENEKYDKDGKLWSEDMKEFDPVLHHRHFCPWVSSNIRKESCGWQLTLDALETSSIKSDSASFVCTADPLSSVRKVLGRSRTSMKVLKK